MIREKSRCFLFVFLCGLLSIGLIQTPASAGERISQERVLQHAISSHSMSVGQVYQGQVELPGVEGTLLLLPPGQFEVVLFEITRNDNNSRLGHIILVNLIGNTVSAAVNLLYSIDGELVEDNPSTTGRSAMMGTRKSDRCDRRNMYFIQTYLNNQSGQDCFGLTHSIATLVGSEYKLNRKVGEKLISNGISLPQLFLTSWYRFANYHLYQVEYHFNPEIYGFGPQERATWLGSSWHPSAIWNDPIKNSFKDVVLKWTKDHYDFVKSAAIEELRTPDYRPRVKGNYRRGDLGMTSVDFNAGRRLKRIGIIVKDDKNVCDSAVDRATLNWSTKNTSDVYTAKDLGYSVLDCLKLLTDTRK